MNDLMMLCKLNVLLFKIIRMNIETCVKNWKNSVDKRTDLKISNKQKRESDINSDFNNQQFFEWYLNALLYSDNVFFNFAFQFALSLSFSILQKI